MLNEKGRTSGEEALPKRPSARTVRRSVPESSQPVPGDRIEYECLGGGEPHEADAAYRIDKYTKRPRWFIGSFSTRCPGGRECLRCICEWLAELGIDVTPEQLLTDPRPALLAAGARAQRKDRPPPPLPSLGMIGGWHSALLEHQNGPALNYLLGRGVSLEVIEQFRVGWDRDRQLLTFPMRGRLLKTRAAHDGAQMRNWPGRDRDWPLYPEVPREARWLLLLAGELDALAGISVGLPAVSVTLGVGAWRPAWTDELKDAGLPVAVCFDNNETALARWRVKQLNKAGIRARWLDLRWLGFAEPKGDLSGYLNSGGDPKRIKLPRRRTK